MPIPSSQHKPAQSRTEKHLPPAVDITRIALVGDSNIASGHIYAALTELFPDAFLANIGFNGASVSVHPNNPDTPARGFVALQTKIAWDSALHSGDPYDWVIMNGGINDWLASTPLGTLADNAPVTSFYGGLNDIGIYGTFFRTVGKLSKLLLLSPMEATPGAPGTLAVNLNGDTVEDFGNATEEVCKRWGFDFLRPSGVSGAFGYDSTSDGLHFNQNGGNKIGRQIYNYITRVGERRS